MSIYFALYMEYHFHNDDINIISNSMLTRIQFNFNFQATSILWLSIFIIKQQYLYTKILRFNFKLNLHPHLILQEIKGKNQKNFCSWKSHYKIGIEWNQPTWRCFWSASIIFWRAVLYMYKVILLSN